jgi:BMFP domain-containing protein YqiC
MQTNNPFLDDLAKLATGAAGAVQGMRQEMENAMRARFERLIVDMDLVPRAEFDAVKAMAAAALDRIEALEARITALETQAATKD